MNDWEKSQDQLLAELESMRQRIGELETQLALCQQAEADDRQIKNSLPVLVATAGLDGYYRKVNAAFEQILGWSEQESLSRPFIEFIVPEDRTLAAKALAGMRSGEPAINVVDRNICKDGSYRWINWVVIPVPGRDVVFGIGQDITEQRRIELMLRESEERFRRIFDEGPLGVSLADLDGRIQQINRRFCALLGYSEREMVELGVTGVSHPDDNQLDAQLSERLAAGEIPFYTIAKRFLCKDGRVIWGQVTVSLLRNAEGQPTHFIGMVEDITGRKRAEEELQLAKNRLEQRVVERTSELTTANELLQAEVAHRRQAEQAVRDSEERLTSALEASGIGAWDADLSARTSRCSTEYARILGYDALPPSWSFESFLQHVLPEDREAINRQIGQSLAAQGDYDFECRIRRPSGEIRWIWVAGRHRPEPSGKPRHRAGIVQDITERKRAEEAIRQSEAKYRALVESSPDAVVEADLQGRIIFASRRAAEQHGLDQPADLVGHPATDYVAGADRDRFRASLDRLIEDDVHRNLEYSFSRHDESTFNAELCSAVIRDAEGKPETLMAVYRDITERKQTQEMLRQTCEELRASRERFELVVRGSGAGIWDWDLRTGIVYYSSRWKTLFGYEEHEIGDCFEAWARLLHPDERDRIVRLQEEFLAGTSETLTAEYRLRHKDGTYRWIVARGIAVRDERGKACRLVGSHTDITDRKLAEEKVKAEQRALRRMVQAGDRERRLITYELHDGVAQQLLGAMLQFESQSFGGRKSPAGEAYREAMEGLRHASSELRRVMNWLRTPVLDKFGVAEALEDVAAQLRLPPGAPKIEYRHDVQFERLEPTLENSLFRIAQEAMINACRHSQSKKIRVKLIQKDGEVILEVRDGGIGFDPEAVPPNRFGLEGIRERTRILGGRLSIKSEPGKGTVIRVAFPIIEATGQE